jgi:proteasome lid subunit RPN8/RPN11
VPRCVEVDETVPEAEIAPRILNELCAYARESLPEECCGLILSDGQERFGRVVRCRNVMTARHHEDPVNYPRDARQAYFMSPEDYQLAQKDADLAGERITAVYHSHVDSRAYLSEMDLEYANHTGFPFPNADQIVIAVFEGKVHSLVLFQREDQGGEFEGRRIAWGGS